MRLKEIPGFVVYDIYKRMIFQRGHMEKMMPIDMRYAFDQYHIRYVIGMARHFNIGLRLLMNEGIIDEYIYYPISDGNLSNGTIDSLVGLAENIASKISKDSAVLCHCNAGRNRSGLMCALILCCVAGISGSEALEIVRKERPRAIATPFFESLLKDIVCS